ncbi:uncharacterized protein LOC144762324 [Lissotriton helveticus]
MVLRHRCPPHGQLTGAMVGVPRRVPPGPRRPLALLLRSGTPVLLMLMLPGVGGAKSPSCHEVRTSFQIRQIGPLKLVPEVPAADAFLYLTQTQDMPELILTDDEMRVLQTGPSESCQDAVIVKETPQRSKERPVKRKSTASKDGTVTKKGSGKSYLKGDVQKNIGEDTDKAERATKPLGDITKTVLNTGPAAKGVSSYRERGLRPSVFKDGVVESCPEKTNVLILN